MKKTFSLLLTSLMISSCTTTGKLTVCQIDTIRGGAQCGTPQGKKQMDLLDLDKAICMPESDAKSYFLSCESAKKDLISCQKK